MLIEKISSIPDLKNREDFFVCRCELSSLLESFKTKEEKREILKSGLVSYAIEKVFSNVFFNKALTGAIGSDKEFFSSEENRNLVKADLKSIKADINFDDKQHISLGLYLAFSPLAHVFEIMLPHEINNFRTKLRIIIKEIQKNQEGVYTLSDICFQFYDIINNFNYNFKGKFPLEMDDEFMFQNMRVSHCLIGSIFLIIPQNNAFQLNLVNWVKRGGNENFSISSLSSLYKIAFKISAGLEYFCKNYKRRFKNESLFLNFINCFQTNDEKNTRFIFLVVTAGLHVRGGSYFHKTILDKIRAGAGEREKIAAFCQSNLRAYSSKLKIEDAEWSNKIYLASYKTLSLLEGLESASDEGWKVKVAVRELEKWMEETYKIINKYEMEDDWGKIEKFLRQEDEMVEWKSSFFIATQDSSNTAKRDKKILLPIVKAMLGMMNTDGGVILVGVIENLEEVVNEEVLDNIMKKNENTFFNIDYELRKYNKDMDGVKRHIQDELRKLTNLSIERFNGLWTIEPIEIRHNTEKVVIYKIEVKKSGFLICNKMNVGDVVWFNIYKRANARTIVTIPNVFL